MGRALAVAGMSSIYTRRVSFRQLVAHATKRACLKVMYERRQGEVHSNANYRAVGATVFFSSRERGGVIDLLSMPRVCVLPLHTFCLVVAVPDAWLRPVQCTGRGVDQSMVVAVPDVWLRPLPCTGEGLDESMNSSLHSLGPSHMTIAVPAVKTRVFCIGNEQPAVSPRQYGRCEQGEKIPPAIPVSFILLGRGGLPCLYSFLKQSFVESFTSVLVHLLFLI